MLASFQNHGAGFAVQGLYALANGGGYFSIFDASGAANYFRPAHSASWSQVVRWRARSDGFGGFTRNITSASDKNIPWTVKAPTVVTGQPLWKRWGGVDNMGGSRAGFGMKVF